MGSQYAKAPLEPQALARNGSYPDAYMAAELADHINTASRFRMREVFRGSASIVAGIPTANGDRTRWRFAFHSGPYMSVMWARAVVALTTVSGGNAPFVRVRFANSAAATLGDIDMYGGGGTSSESAPNYWTICEGLVDLSSYTNTDIRVTVSDNDQARCVSLVVYETPLLTAPPGPMPEGISIGRPIFDKDREDATLACRKMWKQGASKLFNWSSNTDATARSTTSTTPRNLIDNTSTAASASAPGFTLDGRYRTTVRRRTVPIKIMVYGSSDSPFGGSVILRDSTNATVATVASITTAGWYSTTSTLTAAQGKYDLFFVDGGGGESTTTTIYSVSVFQYESGT